jgi:hypothetical protein
VVSIFKISVLPHGAPSKTFVRNDCEQVTELKNL